VQTATSETDSKIRYRSICVHHYTSRAPCPKDQGKARSTLVPALLISRVSISYIHTANLPQKPELLRTGTVVKNLGQTNMVLFQILPCPRE